MRLEVDERTLFRAAELAVDYLRRVPDLPVREEATLEELRTALRVPLNDAPIDAVTVVEELVRAAVPGRSAEPQARRDRLGRGVGRPVRRAAAARDRRGPCPYNGLRGASDARARKQSHGARPGRRPGADAGRPARADPARRRGTRDRDRTGRRGEHR